MIHSSYYRPRVFPYKGSLGSAEIDRLQELSGTTNLNREKINEIGTDGTVDWDSSIPEVSLTLRQLEYGKLEFWRKLAAQTNATNDIVLNDFKTSMVDIAGYKTDDDSTFTGTIWYPKLRVSGFSLNIGDPDALIERGFSLVGEDEKIFSDDNKYVVQLNDTSCTGASHTIEIGSGSWADYPSPVALPDESGSGYFLRGVRTRSGTNTELTEGTDFTYDSGTTTITISGSQSGDEYTFTYTAGSYITDSSPFTSNSSDVGGLKADTASIYLETSNYVYRLQSVGIDVTFDRQDTKEIGDKDVVARGIREKTVRVTLGRIIENFTVEQILRGASSGYGQYDVRKFQDDIKLTIKLYDNNDKDTFQIGYSFADLSPVSVDAGVPTKDYITKGATLEGEDCTVASTEGLL